MVLMIEAEARAAAAWLLSSTTCPRQTDHCTTLLSVVDLVFQVIVLWLLVLAGWLLWSTARTTHCPLLYAPTRATAAARVLPVTQPD